jgi:hypothetical protein
MFVTSGESLLCRAKALGGSLACMETENGDPGETLTDEELTALALAADLDAPLAEGAVPIGIHLAQLGSALPLWYMPPVVRQGGRRWKAPFVIAVVSAFLLIDLMGLCNTYGILNWA